jgi:hypothetical protein
LSTKAERITAAGVLLTGVFAAALIGAAARLPGATAVWIGGGSGLLAVGLVWGEIVRRAAPALLLVAILAGFFGPVIFAASLDG